MKTIEEEIKQTKFRSAQQKAMLNLIFTSNWLENKHRDYFKEYGLTNQQFNILRILKGQHPSKISGTEIKSRMLDKNSDVSRLLDRMILKKLVIKSQCPNDKRSADVGISDLGISLLQKIDRTVFNFAGSLEQLTEDEANQLSYLLDRCRS
jgi:DNA-binding MarR family transcriptional regulator